MIYSYIKRFKAAIMSQKWNKKIEKLKNVPYHVSKS